MRLILVLTLLQSLSSFANVALTDTEGTETCSGAVFKMKGMDLTQKAMIITNGHCLHRGSEEGGTMPATGEHFINEAHDGQAVVRGHNRSKVTAPVAKLIYGTMTGTDLAVVQLDLTYEQLMQRNSSIKVYDLSESPPEANDRLVAYSSLHDRRLDCTLQGNVNLAEQGWRWNNALKLGQVGDSKSKPCLAIPGVSGSPIFNPKTREIVGLINSSVEDEKRAAPKCDRQDTCEVLPDGKLRMAQKGQTYGVQSYQLYSCYDRSSQKFDFRKPECALPTPAGYKRQGPAQRTPVQDSGIVVDIDSSQHDWSSQISR